MGSQNKKETYAQSLTPFCTYFRLNLYIYTFATQLLNL